LAKYDLFVLGRFKACKQVKLGCRQILSLNIGHFEGAKIRQTPSKNKLSQVSIKHLFEDLPRADN
jgi:hypothetical protein